MKKDQYLPHDVTARLDEKMMIMIEQEGMKGYGIYWALIEQLRTQEEYHCSLQLINPLAYQIRCTVEEVEIIIRKYKLFIIEGDFFYSAGLAERMQALDEKRQKLSNAGKKGNVIKAQKESEIQLARQAYAVKESKESKESKAEKVKTPPTSSSEEKGNGNSAAADNDTFQETQKPTPPDPLEPYLGWEKYIDQLDKETVWKETTAMHSGMSRRFIDEFPTIQDFFKQHLRCQGKESNIMNLNEAKSYLYNFVSNKSTRQKLIEALDRKRINTSFISRFEQVDKDGNRSYNGIPIPTDAPLRPNDRCYWNPGKKQWC